MFGHECTSIFGFDLRINPRFWRRGIGFHVRPPSLPFLTHSLAAIRACTVVVVVVVVVVAAYSLLLLLLQLIRRLRKMYNEVNPHWVHGFILQENVASLHMNREQCILTTMRWLGWSTENLLPEPGDTRQRSDSSEADNDADNDEEAEAEAEPDYTIRIVSAEEALTLLTETFALSNFFPLDMGTTILVRRDTTPPPGSLSRAHALSLSLSLSRRNRPSITEPTCSRTRVAPTPR